MQPFDGDPRTLSPRGGGTILEKALQFYGNKLSHFLSNPLFFCRYAGPVVSTIPQVKDIYFAIA